VANVLSDMLITSITSSKRFEVVERSDLGSIIDEQALGASGAVNPATAAQLRKLKGADYIILGSVTEADSGQQAASSTGSRSRLSSLRFRKSSVSLAIDVRFINTETGTAVYAKTFRETDKSIGLGVGGINFEGESPAVGELGRVVINNISKRMLIEVYPPKLIKYSEDNGQWIVSYGEGMFTAGDAIGVYRQGESILDPDTGQKLGIEDKKVGVLVIERVDTSVSYARVASGEVIAGDICRFDESVDESEAATGEKSGGGKKKRGNPFKRKNK
jgi:TolB-like protein